MEWLHAVAYFFGGIFLMNTLPHLAAGVMGQPFQSPFAKPPGEGHSTSRVNVFWALFNLAVAYLLLVRVGNYDLRSWLHVGATFLGFLAIGPWMAGHFGKFNGGNNPTK